MGFRGSNRNTNSGGMSRESVEPKRPVRLAYSVFDPADWENVNLSPVIFLHGMLSTKEVWDTIPQTVANMTKRKAFALDSRNHGDSEYTDVYNFDANVIDLFHFLDTMKIKKAVLVGHSMGGTTAINAALQDEKERIKMIFVEDMYSKKVAKSGTLSTIEYCRIWEEAVESIPIHLNETEGIKFVKDIVHKRLFTKDQTFYCKVEDTYNEKIVLRRKPSGGYIAKYNTEILCRALANYDTLMSIPRGQYNGPSFFLYGSSSQLNVHKEEDHIRRHFPQAELIEYKDATHNVHVEFPQKFTEDIVCRLNQKEDST